MFVRTSLSPLSWPHRMSGPRPPRWSFRRSLARAERALRHRPDDLSAFLSPAKPTNGWLWGAGPVVQIPTISDASLGSNVWGSGPTGVLVYMNGPWVVGDLANNVWSFGGTKGPGGTSYNNFLDRPSSTTISARAGMSASLPSSLPKLAAFGDQVDRADRRRGGARVPGWQTADQSVAQRLLQRREATVRCRLAIADAGDANLLRFGADVRPECSVDPCDSECPLDVCAVTRLAFGANNAAKSVA
jgi:hypothetical protein